jgi:hypothetical protein
MKIAGWLALLLPLTIARAQGAAATFVSVDIGSPAVPGATNEKGGIATMTAGGKDVWGVSDQFRFDYEKRAGDFDVAVRVQSLVPAQLYSRIGIMARESLAPASRQIFFVAFSDNQSRHNNRAGYELQFREQGGGRCAAIYPLTAGSGVSLFRVAYPNTWLRLRRRGNEFTAFSSSDGARWTAYGSKAIRLPASVYLGMALTAHDAAKTATASFSAFRDVK